MILLHHKESISGNGGRGCNFCLSGMERGGKDPTYRLEAASYCSFCSFNESNFSVPLIRSRISIAKGTANTNLLNLEDIEMILLYRIHQTRAPSRFFMILHSKTISTSSSLSVMAGCWCSCCGFDRGSSYKKYLRVFVRALGTVTKTVHYHTHNIVRTPRSDF